MNDDKRATLVIDVPSEKPIYIKLDVISIAHGTRDIYTAADGKVGVLPTGKVKITINGENLERV